MSEQELLDRIIEELDKRIRPMAHIPLEAQLWSTKEIGEYLQRPAKVVRERVVNVPGFPAPIRLPNPGSLGKAQPRWKAIEVIKWVESYQGGKMGRPRKPD
ncbi:hypothetical protein [Cupriavidus pauculus]|uniref:hypothetical protein n=1 Tax=Cupriavidus pauculus TaxID=82633 RepID=UPI001EE210BA|nr:hypothetical protein [Cupriavidus pauculus]GJG92887.1 hypothetical protein CBA19C6_00380 [Cupriavidus pauculus]